MPIVGVISTLLLQVRCSHSVSANSSRCYYSPHHSQELSHPRATEIDASMFLLPPDHDDDSNAVSPFHTHIFLIIWENKVSSEYSQGAEPGRTFQRHSKIVFGSLTCLNLSVPSIVLGHGISGIPTVTTRPIIYST